MRSILNALQDGRLFELQENNKEECLEFLARVLDANPDIEFGADAIEEIKKRELECNTGIGMGVAVPHMRARRAEGELFCAIGWSAEGIAYGSPDGAPVHLVLMYYIPDAQKNVYLKEISVLVKAMRKTGGIEPIAHASNLNVVRNLLLDWVSEVVGESGPDTIARMIKLEVRQAQAPPAVAGAPVPEAAAVTPTKSPKAVSFQILFYPPANLVALTPDAQWVAALEKEPTLMTLLTSGNAFTVAGRQVYVTASRTYAAGRTLFDCTAVIP